MKKILITNIVVLNGGDGAILFGMIKTLRRAFGDDCKILVYASRPDVASRMFPEIEFRETLGLAATRAPFANVRFMGRICRTLQQIRYLTVAWCWVRGLRFLACLLPNPQRGYLKEYASADLVASSGGTYLKEEYGVISQVCDYRLTLLLRRPLVFFTQSLGPFTHSATRRTMKSIFSQSLCLLLRDYQSRNNVQDLGVTGVPIHLAADAAFALADPAVLEAAKKNDASPHARLRVVISVRHWPHFATCTNEEGMARYRQSIAAGIRGLIALGADVTFLSTCQGIPEYTDDSVEAEQVVRLLDTETASRVHIVRVFVRFDELMVRLREFDLCIGTRMHMCILSLISGIPVLPIAYEFKTHELFDELGLGEWVTDIESISPEMFPEHVQDFLHAIPEFREALFGKVLKLQESALQSGIYIRDVLGVGR
jgi:colanic acid/amylovoran biosynthesis protein